MQVGRDHDLPSPPERQKAQERAEELSHRERRDKGARSDDTRARDLILFCFPEPFRSQLNQRGEKENKGIKQKAMIYLFLNNNKYTSEGGGTELATSPITRLKKFYYRNLLARILGHLRRLWVAGIRLFLSAPFESFRQFVIELV